MHSVHIKHSLNYFLKIYNLKLHVSSISRIFSTFLLCTLTWWISDCYHLSSNTSYKNKTNLQNPYCSTQEARNTTLSYDGSLNRHYDPSRHTHTHTKKKTSKILVHCRAIIKQCVPTILPNSTRSLDWIIQSKPSYNTNSSINPRGQSISNNVTTKAFHYPLSIPWGWDHIHIYRSQHCNNNVNN